MDRSKHPNREASTDDNQALRLHHLQKLSTLGTVTAGILHDINNLLEPILCYAEIGMVDSPEGSDSHTYFKEIVTATESASELVRQIVIFSRKTEDSTRPLNFQHVLTEALRLVTVLTPRNVILKQNLNAPDAAAAINPLHLHQILLNLCVNASDAMQPDGGTLEIRLDVVDARPEDALPNRLIDGDYVCLTVADTGPGIPEDMYERVFEPFFTTKSKDEGVGLGLAIVKDLVDACGGVIDISSESGRGTEFHIYFPLIKNPLAAEIIE